MKRTLFLAWLVLAASSPLAASVLQVTKTADTFDGACDHDCSLREALNAANLLPGAEAILLRPGLYALTRSGEGEDAAQTGDLDVNGELVILGAGASATILDGGALDRVLDVLQEGSLELHGVTVQNGRTGGFGGGIRAVGPLTLNRCVISGSHAGTGGGISALNLSARDSTIANNEADFSGGGIDGADIARFENVTVSGNHARFGGGMLLLADDQELRQVTVTGNTAESGGGLYLASRVCIPEDLECTGHPPPRLVLSGSILAANVAGQYPDCVDVLENLGGFNLIGIGTGCVTGPTDRVGTLQNPLDPRLSPLGGHGGPSPTHLPLAGSPAIDAGGDSCLATDQRGAARPADGDADGDSLCDAGAVEISSTCVPGGARLCLREGRFEVTVRWEAQGNAGDGQALPLTTDTGAFWFFAPTNLELMIKVLDGCAINQRFWVFLSGLTDVKVEVSVEDKLTGKSWTHASSTGEPLQPRLDTSALDACL